MDGDGIARLATEPAIGATLTRAHEAARAVHEGVHLPRSEYLEEVLRRVQRRLGRCDRPTTPSAVNRLLEATCLEDLYLTIACDLRKDRAWDRLVATQAPRIDGLARSIGMDVRSGSVGRDLLADLATPPASGAAHSRIGTYDGSGSLFAWLAVILRRKAATRARRKSEPPAPLEPAVLDGRPAPEGEDPYAALVDAEEGGRVVIALRDAWRTLTTREQLALHFRFGESLQLKRIGAMLGLSESGTSRLVSGALARLREEAGPALDAGAVPPSRIQLWGALWRALEQRPVDGGAEAPTAEEGRA